MIRRLGYLASGRGSSAQAIHAAGRRGELKIESAVVISNNSGSPALQWAQADGIPHAHLSSRTHPDPTQLDEAVRDTLVGHDVELVVLSGYAKLVGGATLEQFPRRILNVHPAPLPDFGGQGMYGLAVHQAVLEAGLAHTEITIHLIDDRYDRGPAVATWPVEVLPDDTAESLQARVRAAEPACYIDVLRRVVSGEIDLDSVGNGPRAN